jgi:hypothetical protein
MTVGSWSVAIRRGRPPTVRARQHVNREGPVHRGRPAPGAWGGLHSGIVQTCGPRHRLGRGLRRHAPAAARGNKSGPVWRVR